MAFGTFSDLARDVPRPNTLRDIAGTTLIFVTFTQTGGGGAGQFIAFYTPFLLLGLLMTKTGVRNIAEPDRRPMLFIGMAALIGGLSVGGLQYSVAFCVFLLVLLMMPIGTFVRELPRYAYYAAILNAGLYFGEAILVGQLGLPFDPTVLNYIGVEREGVITTWDFNRYAGHHTEPGSFAINFGSLTVLSLLGGRPANWFHWLAVLTLASTLSITAVVISLVVAVAILLSKRITVGSIVLYLCAVVAAGYALLLVMPLLGLSSIDFLLYRLQERGADDSSIYVKQLLVEDLVDRGGLDFLFGNRHEECSHCPFAKSLGFGFYMVFQGGVLGGLFVSVLVLIAFVRLGRIGLMVMAVMTVSRFEFFYPQAAILYLVITTFPRDMRLTTPTSRNTTPAQ